MTLFKVAIPYNTSAHSYLTFGWAVLHDVAAFTVFELLSLLVFLLKHPCLWGPLREPPWAFWNGGEVGRRARLRTMPAAG